MHKTTFVAFRRFAATSVAIVAGTAVPPTAPAGSAEGPTVWMAPSGCSDGNAGTEAEPVCTLNRANQLAATGSTIYLRAGVYRQGDAILDRANLTVRPAPGDPNRSPVLDGSVPVEGTWGREGTVWVRRAWPGVLPTVEHGSVAPEHRLAGDSNMLFRNGRALRQVAHAGDVGPGTFSMDPDTHDIVVGDDPNGATIEVSAHRNAITSYGAGTTIHGLTIRRYGTAAGDLAGAVQLFGDADSAAGNGQSLEDSLVEDNAVDAVDVVRVDGARLLRNTLQRNGRIGAQLSNGSDGCGGKARTAHVTVRGNKVIGNNTEHFEHSGVAGGLKLGGLAALEVRGNSVRANAGHGIWVDSCSDDVTIVDNVVRSNTDSGITFEISTDGLLADNVVFRNGNHGLFIASSSHVDVWNNTVVDNPQGQIWVVRQLHRDPPGNETSGITIRNTSFSQTSDAWGSSLAATTMGSSETYRALSQMGVTADHDAYWQGGTACPPATADLPAVAGQTVYCTLAEVVAGLGLEANGVEARGGGNPFLVNPARGDFRIPTDRSPSSPALCGGEPLPDEVASAIGPPAVAGAAVRIGAFVARQTGAC